ncbi:MAG: reverse transcriptase family protein [Pedobacter sp.]
MIKYELIKNIDGLSLNLGVTRAYLTQAIESPILQYNVAKIPKRGGKGRRTLYLANDILKGIQKIIRDDLTDRTKWPDCVHGFVKDRSIATNAKLHLSKRVILNLDIKSYFESIDKAKVAQVFCTLGATEKIGDLLAAICTCDDYLVPGTVCAPIISNMVFSNCDKDLLEIAAKFQCTYSRYVDDITFSGENTPPIKEIDNVLKYHGFFRNTEKTFRQTRGRRQYVTGLTVFDRTIPRIPKWKKNEFRKKIHFMEKYGIDGHLSRIGSRESVVDFVIRFDGLISFYLSIEPHFISKYMGNWQKAKNSWGY